MAGYFREDIRGTSPQDIMKINENTTQLWSKVFGDINFSDTDEDLKNKIATQWIQVQGEGNFDRNNPLRIRFFVPPNTKKIKSTDFNFVLERYKMDSGITSGGGGVAGGDINMSIAGGGACTASGTVPSRTASVKHWGTYPYQYSAPTRTIYPDSDKLKGALGGYVNINGSTLGTITLDGFMNGTSVKQNFVDFYLFQHTHEIPSMSVNVNVPSHTHRGTANITIPSHYHQLEEAIQISKHAPSGIKIKINGTSVNNNMSESNPTLNNLNNTDLIKIGAWNIIEIETTNVARMTVYGTVEVIQDYFK